jgi:hypothetical protein
LDVSGLTQNGEGLQWASYDLDLDRSFICLTAGKAEALETYLCLFEMAIGGDLA